MEILTIKKIILKNFERLEPTAYRGRVGTLKLWMEFALSNRKEKDTQKLYRLHQSALELLIKNEEIKNVGGKTISDSEFELMPKGREILDGINRNLIKKFYFYFETQIKSKIFTAFMWIINSIAFYLLGHLKNFLGQ